MKHDDVTDGRQTRTTSTRLQLPFFTAGALALVFALSACTSDGATPDESIPDDIPVYDNDVPDGVNTETDEGRNQGFEDDEPSGNGAVVNPPESD